MAKLHYFTALLLIILLAIVSGWVFESIDIRPKLTKEKLRHDPDYFLKNFTATTVNKSGKPAYKVKAQYLEHYPDDNSTKLQRPLFSFYENNIMVWTAQANEAVILQNNETIYLNGQATLKQATSRSITAPMVLTADQLTIEPEKKLAHTKTKIKLQKGHDAINAIGMRADMSNNRIEFLQKTRSQYVLPEK